MKKIFAKRIKDIKASEIRELLKITENHDIISFAGGLPAPELFPVEEIATITSKLILEEGKKALQYSTTEGYIPLRKKIAYRMNKIFNTKVNEDEILITSGSQQALDIIGKVFLDEGDVVFCERPSYLGALNAFRGYGAKFSEIPTDNDGMIPEELEKTLASTFKRKLIYVIPDFQNPTGRTWSLERRKALLDIANKYQVMIVEDNPYGELRFDGEILPALKSLDTSNSVMYLGTFSKTFCPGMRIGWISVGEEVLEKCILVKQGADLHTSTINQMQLNMYLENYDLDTHIQRLKKVYKCRRDALIAAMSNELPLSIKFNIPDGGLFTWLEMPDDMDSRVLLDICLKKGVAFVPGHSFYANTSIYNTFRINYSNMPEDRIVEGVKRIATGISELKHH
ncbi:UNVERIFIED_CONTAM: 2-aminoadipate transaminase [Acetivibrio alkalicellulosi]